MFAMATDEITEDATITKDGATCGEASFANRAQRRLFAELIIAGVRPARAAEESGAIYIPA
ncbi:hypothetical protein ACOI1H_20670 [Loktanella sp. DJP18]|uniref:hypothetical protein n=1 Tax=Loktanella sp. DJP18 TaxID=3409788 RepID=UPI003BB5D144